MKSSSKNIKDINSSIEHKVEELHKKFNLIENWANQVTNIIERFSQ
jgi:flagellar capping protein FliD